MRILYLHQYFATREGSSATRSYEFARRLVDGGHQVTVVTAQIGPGETGRLPVRRTTVDGIDVLVVSVPYSQYFSYGMRLVSFAAFTLGATAASLVLPRPDVVFATSTPLTIGIPGMIAARAKRAPLVFEIRDLWPEAPIAIGALTNPLLITIAQGLERAIYNASARVVVLAEASRDALTAQGVPAAKLAFIPNSSDLDLFRPDGADDGFRAEHGLEDRFVALYAGAMGKANGLDQLIDAALALQQEGERRIALVAIGDGSERPRLEARVRDLGLKNLLFLPPRPKQTLPGILASVDATLTLFAPDPVFETTSPNKFFDGLACGRPVIVNVDGWLRRLVEDDAAGLYVPAADGVALAAALAALAAEPEVATRMGAHARRLAEREFSRDAMARRLLEVLTEVVAEPAA